MGTSETVRDISMLVGTQEGVNFSHYVGNFLDYFYRDAITNAEREELIADPPVENKYLADWELCYLAGMTHSLCITYGLKKPSWIRDPKYILPYPKFSMDAKGDYRLVLLHESPYPFKSRNLFMTANTLSRV